MTNLTITASDVETKDGRCDLCHSYIFSGVNYHGWFICGSCPLPYENESDLIAELENETGRRFTNYGNIGMCMECGELSEHSDLCSRIKGE